MKHFRINKRANRIPVFIPGVYGQKNISNLSKPNIPKKMMWNVHSVLKIEWEFDIADSLDNYEYAMPFVKSNS